MSVPQTPSTPVKPTSGQNFGSNTNTSAPPPLHPSYSPQDSAAAARTSANASAYESREEAPQSGGSSIVTGVPAPGMMNSSVPQQSQTDRSSAMQQDQQQDQSYATAGSQPQWPAAEGPDVTYAYPENRGADWITGPCDCLSSIGSSCDACWCADCALSQQYNMLTNGRSNEMHGLFCWGLICLECLFLGGIARCGATWYLRDQIQERYGFKKNCCADCCLVFWCGCCAQVQQQLEMTRRGDWPGNVCCGEVPTYVSEPPSVMRIS